MRILLIVCAALGITFVVMAQSGSMSTQAPALVGTATNGQTIIHSHQSQIFMRSNVYVWSENVRVDNPQMQLRCELLTVEAPKIDSENGKFNRATAETNVVIDWVDDKGATNHATSDKAVYTYVLTNVAVPPAEQWQTNAFVVLTGNPVVTGPQGTWREDPLIWNRITDVISSTNFHEAIINPTGTNSPGLFDTTSPKPKPAPK
jgi:lipopolysaccharide export system protein LptA